MAGDANYVGWQFRYVFEDQGNRRSAWSSVLTDEPSFTSGYRSYNGWQRHYFFEVRRVYADAVENYIEDADAAIDAAMSAASPSSAEGGE